MDLPTYRKKHGLTQSEFAALLGNAGYPATQSLISQWENGTVALTGDRCAQVERVTGGKVKRRTLRPDLFGRVA